MFNRLSAAEVILQRTHKGHVNIFHLSHPHNDSPCPPAPPKKSPSLPLHKHIILPPALAPSLPSAHLHPPFLRQRMRSIPSILPLFRSTVVFPPAPPNTSNLPHLLCLIPPSQIEAIVSFASWFTLPAPMSAVSTNPLFVKRYLLHQVQGVQEVLGDRGFQECQAHRPCHVDQSFP